MIAALPACGGSPLTAGPPTTLTLPTDAGDREVTFALPAEAPPAAGHPVVVLYQGSWVPPDWAWEAETTTAFGAAHQVETVQALLDAGFAVLVPALPPGLPAWNTNVPPWPSRWEDSPDDALVDALLAAIPAGVFGPLDADRVHAVGISSGGYMTSRMALSYPGAFRALVIVAASWATCAGPACSVPDALPDDHPPTLFLHGGLDVVVPTATMWPYHDALVDQGTATDAVVAPLGGHAWPEGAAEEVVGWFEREG